MEEGCVGDPESFDERATVEGDEFGSKECVSEGEGGGGEDDPAGDGVDGVVDEKKREEKGDGEDEG